MALRRRAQRVDRAVVGFSRVADIYDRARPEYPSAAVRFLMRRLGLRRGTIVVELAAGTGKFTRAMRGSNATIIAVEPTKEMRQVFARRIPDLPVFDGTAESIPLPNGFADAAVAAQAFHWFQPRRALKEIARVLRRGGAVGLIWNVQDKTTPWIRKLGALIEPYGRGARRYRDRRWKNAIVRSRAFTRLQYRRFRFRILVDPATVVDRLLSVSFVALQPAPVRRAIARRVRDLLRNDPATMGRARVEYRYHTDVYWCYRR